MLQMCALCILYALYLKNMRLLPSEIQPILTFWDFDIPYRHCLLRIDTTHPFMARGTQAIALDTFAQTHAPVPE
jgi:hypothetical protein